jgi:hypothetical protein
VLCLRSNRRKRNFKFLKCLASKLLKKVALNRQTEQLDMNAAASDPNTELESIKAWMMIVVHG